MGPQVTGAVALAVAALAVLVLWAQPARSWDAAAEHSRAFWSAWIVASVVIGLLPTIEGFGWGAAAWLAVCCGFGALQPAFVIDVVEVRRHLARIRERGQRARAEARIRLEGGAPRDSISWRAR